MRWVLFAQEYDFVIKHCRGADNIVADFFSRNFEDRSSEGANDSYYAIRQMAIAGTECPVGESPGKYLIASLLLRKEILNDLLDLPRVQAEDEVITKLKGKESPALSFILLLGKMKSRGLE